MTDPTFLSSAAVDALTARIVEELRVVAARVVGTDPDDIAEWLEDVTDQLATRAIIKRSEGVLAPESLTFVVELRGEHLLTVRAADLAEVDVLATADELLWQAGHGLPDDLSSLDSL